MMLTVSGIHFSYNSHPALSDIGFSLKPGQVLGVLGVNGAGKTTLLKCLNRILRPQQGTVLLEKTDVLLLDEPTSNLDIKNQLEVMGMIRRVVREQSLSAVVSIHDLNLAVRFADAFLFIKDHRVHALHARDELTVKTIREVYGVDVTLVNVGDHILVAPK